jgi:hypothetical protein
MNASFNHIMQAIAKGDTSKVESYFCLPGGRKYLENITLILINTLPHPYAEKEALYRGFVAVLDRLEQRIKRQKEGGAILESAMRDA